MTGRSLRVGVDVDDVPRTRKERQSSWYQANRERILAARKTPEGRARHNARARNYHAEHKDQINARRRDRHILSRHGLTPQAFDALFASQGNACAICRCTEVARGWHVDHDHTCCPESSRSCGRCIRGILCGPCNKSLGGFKDSPDVLLQAVAYLRSAA